MSRDNHSNYFTMGLFFNMLFGSTTSTKTKSDWDEEILQLTEKLSNLKVDYLRASRWDNNRYQKEYLKTEIEKTKGKIAKAKLMRKNAPKD